MDEVKAGKYDGLASEIAHNVRFHGREDGMGRRGGAGEDTVAAWISREITRRGWSQRQLARRAGLSVGAINDIINRPDSRPHAGTLDKLRSALGDWPAMDARGAHGAESLSVIDPQGIDMDMPSEISAALAAVLAGEPDRWVFAIHAAPGGIAILGGGGDQIVLIDRRAALENGALVAILSPAGGGLRYLVDPFLVGGAGLGGAFGYDIRGAEGVVVLGRVALRLSVP